MTSLKEPVFVQKEDDTATSSSASDDNNSLGRRTSCSSTDSTDSDPVKTFNKLRRQGSRSSVLLQPSARREKDTGNLLVLILFFITYSLV